MGRDSAITNNEGDLSITPELWATAHRFLWHGPTRTAILSDLHLGLEETLGAQGIFMPDTLTSQLRERWRAMAERRPARVIIAGDLFDAEVSERAVAMCRELVATAGCPVTVIPGNHDPDEESLRELLRGEDVMVVPHVVLGSVFISHGHNLTLNEVSRFGCATWVVGHQHPAVTLSTAVQSAKMACYAVCDNPGRMPSKLVLLPAFSPGPLGSNLLAAGNWLLPVERPGNERVTILGLVEGRGRVPQVLPFGTLAMHASPRGDC